MPSGGRTVGEEMLRPTHIYVREAMEMIEGGLSVKALMHITGDGFLNLARVAAPVGFEIESLPAIPEIFSLIQTHARIGDDEMYRVFNMGIGFCVVVAPEETERALGIVWSHGKQAQVIGRAIDDPARRISIKTAGLISQGKRFVPA
jgi:phosphoribosylformylglycinamidine cyclo-ligase